jgi:phosphotransferase system IIB component
VQTVEASERAETIIKGLGGKENIDTVKLLLDHNAEITEKDIKIATGEIKELLMRYK